MMRYQWPHTIGHAWDIDSQCNYINITYTEISFKDWWLSATAEITTFMVLNHYSKQAQSWYVNQHQGLCSLLTIMWRLLVGPRKQRTFKVTNKNYMIWFHIFCPVPMLTISLLQAVIGAHNSLPFVPHWTTD